MKGTVTCRHISGIINIIIKADVSFFFFFFLLQKSLLTLCENTPLFAAETDISRNLQPWAAWRVIEGKKRVGRCGMQSKLEVTHFHELEVFSLISEFPSRYMNSKMVIEHFISIWFYIRVFLLGDELFSHTSRAFFSPAYIQAH